MFSNIALIVLYLGAGVVLQMVGTSRLQLARVLNQWVIWVAYPSIIIHKLPGVLDHLSLSLLAPLLMPVAHFAMAGSILLLVGKFAHCSKLTLGALILTTGLGNTSFVGFPLVKAYFGDESLTTALIVDLGTFFCVSTFGIAVASLFSGQKPSYLNIAWEILKFPPFIFMMGIGACSAIGITGWTEVYFFDWLGQTLAPTALVAVGLRLTLSKGELAKSGRWLGLGLLLKLLVLPFAFFWVYRFVLGGGDVFKIIVFEAAMASMITANIVAERYKLDSSVSGLMVGVGIPISLVTTFFWQMFLHSI